MRGYKTKEIPITEEATNTLPEKDVKNDVLRDPAAFGAPTKTKEASWQSLYIQDATLEWARLQRAERQLEDACDANFRYGTRIKPWREAKEKALADFDATSPGKLLSDMRQAVQQAKDRFDATPENENLTNATQATKRAKKELEDTAEWKSYNKYIKTENSYRFRSLESIEKVIHKEGKKEAFSAVQALDEWRKARSAQKHEQEAQKQVNTSSKLEQYERLDSLVRKALTAWASFQKAALYQYSQDIQERTTALSQKHWDARNEAYQAQPKKRSALERMVTSKNTMLKEDEIYSEKQQQEQKAKRAFERMDHLSREVEDLKAWEPDKRKEDYGTKKAQWERLKRDFQAFREALGDKDVQDVSVEDLNKAMEAGKL